ncbi:MAG: cytochrome c oxidase subunit 3 [Phyllobacterium sp.]
MNTSLIFLAIIGAIVIWWMRRQGLLSKPWLEVGIAGEHHTGSKTAPAPNKKIGLGVFLAVVGALFSLAISAYFMRMGLNDWWAIPLPRILWLNTAALAMSSIALHWAKVEAQNGENGAVKLALSLALMTTLAFLSGQFIAWQELVNAGYLVADNPSNSFFYLITGMHGLHIIGGLVALGRTMNGFWKKPNGGAAVLNIELCAIYWHFMLLVWLVLFGLFAGWANDFVAICRQLLS